tara:strand:- start:292321 stop:292614 length:294 start_codon:yes stop_codon:yes gene_type:complete
MMKFLRWLVLAPVTLFVIVLAIANRQSVTFSLDPFDPLEPALGVTMPLALILLLAVLLGIVIGGVASWAQTRAKAARRNPPVLPSTPATGSLPAAQD